MFAHVHGDLCFPLLAVDFLLEQGQGCSWWSANTQKTRTKYDDQMSTENLLCGIKKSWHRYPGIGSVLTVALDLIQGHKSKEVECTSEKASEKVETLAATLTAWRQPCARLPVRVVAQVIAELTLSSLPSLPQETLKVDDRLGSKALMKKIEQISSPPSQHTFAEMFTGTLNEAPGMMTQALLHLIRAEQKTLQHNGVETLYADEQFGATGSG